MKKENSKTAIICNKDYGPCFGYDISLIYQNIIINKNIIHEPYYFQYECHPEYKSSLYVNTDGPDNENSFSVLDYEVYSFDICKEYIYNVCKYPDIMMEYIETNDISEESLRMINNEDEIQNDLNLIQCKDTSIRLKISRSCLKNPSEYLLDTQLVDSQYDVKLREWLGNDYKWRLIYRASEHGYTSYSFHKYCDDKGPTLIVIKSDGGWIFGGYTTQSWSENSPNSFSSCEKKDDDAFIFTLKNPHRVEPSRYFSNKEMKGTICCNHNFGPHFGDEFVGLVVFEKCNEEKSFIFISDDTRYECHPEYQSSLFVNTAGPDKHNYFFVLDYEVYCIDYESKYTIDHLCKYPDIIWKCIKENQLSGEALQLFNDDTPLLNDLNSIYCTDSAILLNISQLFMKNPSEYLPDTQIVEKQYDHYLKEWIGDYKMKLINRLSMDSYEATNFYSYYKSKGPKLIVIKSNGGWIFGCYLNNSWDDSCIYIKYIYR